MWLKIWLLYNLLVVGMIEIIGIKSINSWAGVVFPLLLLPLVYHFAGDLILKPISNRHKKLPVTLYKTIDAKADKTNKAVTGQVVSGPGGISDRDRRLFLKLIGSTGLSLFFMSLVSKEAQATFFGSMPGPGTLALKNSAGTTIDPAEKHPTDGYKISQLDDNGTTYIYFGYVNKDGAWYIQRETVSGINTGDYRYFKGSSNFADNWTNRSGLAYDDFEDIF